MFALAFKLTSSTSLTPANDNLRFRLVRNNGNITQAGTPTYGYDALNRVNAENPGSSISYTYDATDNRLTKVLGGTTTTTVPSTSNKISAVGGNSYTYDAAGNITNDGTNTYAWNANGNLATVNTTGGVYTYNVANQRTKKVAGGNTTYYVYGAGGLLYGEYTSAGALVREYVYLNGAPLAQIDAGSPEVLTYLHVDHLGTPRYGTNSGGTSVWAWTADAFGTSTPTGSATVNLRMPGQYADSESGNFYNWNRYYNPAIGRYISSDPIGIAGGLNTFNYAGVNPVMNIDPEGLAPNPLELACVAGPNPVCIAGVAADAATWLAGGIGLAAMMSLSGDTPQCNANTAAGDKPSAAACNKAIKLLEQAIRLAEKGGAKLTEDKKKTLQDKINSGTITSGDLPGGSQGEFPGEFKGMTLNEIRKLCGKSR